MFDVHSVDGRTTLLVGFHLGDPLNLQYARRYMRYCAMPTRFRPPLPAEFASVSTILIEDDRVAARLVNSVPGPEVVAASDALRLRFGASHVESRPDGTVHVSVRASDRAGRTLSADLIFTPAFRATHRLTRTPHETIILNDPLHRVEGELQAFNGAGGGMTTAPRVRQIAGLGYHEHIVALQSLLDEREPITRGRALGGDRVVVVHGNQTITIGGGASGGGHAQSAVAWASRPSISAERLLPQSVGQDAQATVETPAEIEPGRHDDVTEAKPLPWRADRPRVIDSSFASKLLRYDSHPPLGSALAQIIYPRRLAARAFI